MGGEELEFVKEAFATNWIAPLGPHVNAFEQALEGHVAQDKQVACLSSGTAALHLALIMAGVGPKDVVLCQSFTFAASANPIVYLGATPVFVDSEERTWNICPELLTQAIEDQLAKGKKPKAIVAVHLYGMPYDHDALEAISLTYDIPIIEDSAEAMGSTYKGKNCGGLGDYGIYSFNGNKIITTSGGGALICKTKEEKEKAVFLATQARDQAPHYQHSTIGYNYRLSNVLAGIGRGQLKVLAQRVQKRRANYAFYEEALKELSGVTFLKAAEGYFSNRWLSCILLENFEQRETLRLALESQNIESRPLWKPMHLQPAFKQEKSYVNGTSEILFKRGLCLPSGSNLTTETLNQICQIIKQTLS
ncbi:pyridoxal phosphate-dependent aminotransferase [Croceivirga radicis]|uniref:Pyridoxal phosphate-dependent aminotransferase n=2 Tax=Croceivirga radicis TaxID=1929488 RepID=A0A1V6LSM0_9FLAO|nr:pyridoxal phosphate-dependent aminotransferase [Croceivirga radicis]